MTVCTIKRPARRLLAVIALTMTLSACTGGGSDPPESKDEALQQKPVNEVLQLVQTRAQVVADLADGPLEGWSTNTVPCEGRGGETADDGRWYLGATANLRVAPAEQLTTLNRVRDALRQQGYEITEDRSFADGTRGSLSARDPSTAITVRLTTTKALDQVAVGLLSDCYMPVDGGSPAKA
ncbi:hypothetical protein ACQPZK_12015 [Micromonospora sp. CA-249363]|uniref:hypothetical protein n=1 Tax=Micromonospora sp. CA-249363 TaxID=3239963 RepID=UPI003D90C93C